MTIFYKDWGSGQPIVFSHGWPLSADDWDTQLMFFVNDFRVIAHDRRGHGRSTQTSDGHDMDHYADDLAALTAHLDLKNAIHVGHSTGGGEVARYFDLDFLGLISVVSTAAASVSSAVPLGSSFVSAAPSSAACREALAAVVAATELSLVARGALDLRGDAVFLGDDLAGEADRLLRVREVGLSSVKVSNGGISNLGGGVMGFFELAGL